MVTLLGLSHEVILPQNFSRRKIISRRSRRRAGNSSCQWRLGIGVTCMNRVWGFMCRVPVLRAMTSKQRKNTVLWKENYQCGPGLTPQGFDPPLPSQSCAEVEATPPTSIWPTPGGLRWDPFALRWSDGSASRPILAPTRSGNIGLSRELRCRFLRTALAQRITLCSELITLPGPVTVTARSALAFSNRLLDHGSSTYGRISYALSAR